MLQKSLAAAAVIAAFTAAAGTAAAADVTLYGTVDTGFVYTHEKLTGEESDNRFEIASGFNTSSVFGLKGNEEIGDMTVSFVLAVIGIRQEAVERRECREAQRHGNHSEKPADVLDTLEYLGHEVKREQHDDGAEGDGHRKLAHAMLVLGKAGNGRAYQHEDAEHECDEKPHACPSCPAFHAAHMAALATSHITPAKSHFGAMLVSNAQEDYSVANQINQRGRETTWTR